MRDTLFGMPPIWIDRAFASFDDPIFIDAGPSPFGGSRIGTFIKCPQLFAWQFEAGIAMGNQYLEWGSLGHEYEAHLFARWGAEQGGVLVGLSESTSRWPAPLGYVEDLEQLLTATQACQEWCRRRDLWRDFGEVTAAWAELLDRFPNPPGRITGVEIPITMVVGETDQQGFGLYVVEADRDVRIPLQGKPVEGESVMKRRGWIDPRIFDGVRWIHVQTGEEVYPCLLNMTGHPEHGRPILTTKRLDATMERRRYGVWSPEVWDAKMLAVVEPRKAEGAYRVDMSFGIYRAIGEQVWPGVFDDKAVVVHMVQKRARAKNGRLAFERVSVPPAREILRRLPRRILDAEHRLALIQLETLNGSRTVDEWDAAMNSDLSPCDGRYGKCGALAICCDGRAAHGH